MSRIRKLPDSEFEIMNIIWDLPEPVERKDIEERLNTKHKIALTTLLTLLSRLSDKGFIRIEKEGRRARYYKLVDKNDYLSYQSSLFFQQLCNSDMSVFANALCDSEISKKDLEELRRLLEERS
ncbi:MAG: BlaI/MecI/CopY family transcriptional regulator [Erysipelotrichaceae bacterium]|nr:BlaI/MecI/CopY family transcriptional regulator [Erysipelotrichaceae bacterium]